MSKETSYRKIAWDYAKRAPGALLRRYRALNPWGKLVVWLWILFEIALLTFIIIVTPSRIAQYLYDLAQRLSHNPFGWLIFSVAIVVASFPPIIGHTTAMTMCGFAYGVKGFAVAGPASSVGSAIVFVVLRYFFSRRLRQWSSDSDKWQALETVIKAKGLPLIILVRASPLPPWIYANAMFASIENVSLPQFIVATFFVYPKIFVNVFIGSRAAALSDGDQRAHMDTPTKILNSLLVVGGILWVLVSGALIYYYMKKQLRAADVPPEVDELAEEAIDDIDEGAPLLRTFSDPVDKNTSRSAERLSV
ncbi:hypothetical protein PLICRDRAFT_190301 [Plicaturopsis crispa FD-325 SS-3]|nr:hypothetical protein PLICRDRAFT_190301 [Plicaturopsis crispa FD-325 SS-3]